jgi:hypothetical protein
MHRLWLRSALVGLRASGTGNSCAGDDDDEHVDVDDSHTMLQVVAAEVWAMAAVGTAPIMIRLTAS